MSTADTKKKARNILGVPDEADIKEIRRAYRELAKKYHPDINPNDKSLSEKFILITEAFEILCGFKNDGRHGILKEDDNRVFEEFNDNKSYWDWWKKRFRDLF